MSEQKTLDQTPPQEIQIPQELQNLIIEAKAQIVEIQAELKKKREQDK